MVWVEEKSILEDRQARLPQKRENYKQMHKGTADKKGKLKEFMNAKTLTEMRRILWG